MPSADVPPRLRLLPLQAVLRFIFVCSSHVNPTPSQFFWRRGQNAACSLHLPPSGSARCPHDACTAAAGSTNASKLTSQMHTSPAFVALDSKPHQTLRWQHTAGE